MLGFNIRFETSVEGSWVAVDERSDGGEDPMVDSRTSAYDDGPKLHGEEAGSRLSLVELSLR